MIRTKRLSVFFFFASLALKLGFLVSWRWNLGQINKLTKLFYFQACSIELVLIYMLSHSCNVLVERDFWKFVILLIGIVVDRSDSQDSSVVVPLSIGDDVCSRIFEAHTQIACYGLFFAPDITCIPTPQILVGVVLLFCVGGMCGGR